MLSSATVRGVTPILNVSDLTESFAWFDQLGWRRRWECGEPPTFGAVGSGQHEIFLRQEGQGGRGERGEDQVPEAEPPDGNGVWLSIRVDDVNAVYRVCLDARLKVVSAPTDRPWGAREMRVRHPDGHVLRISHQHEDGHPHEGHGRDSDDQGSRITWDDAWGLAIGYTAPNHERPPGRRSR